MSNDLQVLVRSIEARRDDFVRKCNAAIQVLQSGISPMPSLTKEPTKKLKVETIQSSGNRKGKFISLMPLIREAVLAQKAPFIIGDIRAYIVSKYPDAAKKLRGINLSSTLLQFCKSHRFIKCVQSGTHGSPNTYMPIDSQLPSSTEYSDSSNAKSVGSTDKHLKRLYLLREAVKAQPEMFTISGIKAFVKRMYPEQALEVGPIRYLTSLNDLIISDGNFVMISQGRYMKKVVSPPTTSLQQPDIVPSDSPASSNQLTS